MEQVPGTPHLYYIPVFILYVLFRPMPESSLSEGFLKGKQELGGQKSPAVSGLYGRLQQFFFFFDSLWFNTFELDEITRINSGFSLLHLSKNQRLENSWLHNRHQKSMYIHYYPNGCSSWPACFAFVPKCLFTLLRIALRYIGAVGRFALWRRFVMAVPINNGEESAGRRPNVNPFLLILYFRLDFPFSR